MNKKTIIQFLPYLPPHKWWLETHALEWSKWWVKKWFWEVYNLVTNFEQSFSLWEEIVFKNLVIWYKKDWVENLIIPSFEIISNFPVYKIWSKEYRLIIKYLRNKNINIIITRTRFFLTSFIWWLYARKNKIEWCHIEHGSDYVKLNSNFKNIVAKIYDKLIWKWIFKKADKIVWVSEACKMFINNEFTNRDVKVIYRWFDFINIDLENIKEENLKDKFKWKIIIWFIWRLYKWKNVESLVNAYYLLDEKLKNKIQIIVIWDWEDLDRLKKIDKDNKVQGELQNKRGDTEVYFTWWKEFKDALKLQSQFDIHFHTSSPGGWLSWSLVQWIKFAKIVISTPYEWASEIITNKKNWILLKNDSIEEIKRWLEEWIIQFEVGISYLEENKMVINREFMWEENIEKYYNFLK